MKRPAFMGILNVTPDSFSGDGKFAKDAVTYAETLVRDGADIIDLGAESTRPGATLLTADEEWTRLEPVLEGIMRHSWRPAVRLSVDTRHAQTAARSLDIGVDIINDVSSLGDPAMLEVLGEHECDIVVMHALGIPADPKQIFPPDADVVAEILRWKAEVTKKAASRSIAPERLIYDPGIGFGKSPEQSRMLIEKAGELVGSGGRWLIGHSRKSFLGLPKTATLEQRDAATLQYSLQLAESGIDYLRVHNIELHVARFGR